MKELIPSKTTERAWPLGGADCPRGGGWVGEDCACPPLLPHSLMMSYVPGGPPGQMPKGGGRRVTELSPLWMRTRPRGKRIPCLAAPCRHQQQTKTMLKKRHHWGAWVPQSVTLPILDRQMRSSPVSGSMLGTEPT